MATTETEQVQVTRTGRWLWGTLWLWALAALVAPFLIRGYEVAIVWALLLTGFVGHAAVAFQRTRSGS